MGTPKAPWQQMCLIALQTSLITAVADLNTGCAGVEASKPLLALLNRDFSLNPGQQFIEERQAFGISNIKLEERKLGGLLPTTTLEFPLNAYNFSLIALLFFQSGVSEGAAAAYVKTAIPYTSPVCTFWATIADPITGAITSGNNEAIHGAIVKSFTISGQEGGQLKISAEFVGRSFVSDFSDADGVLTASSQAGLLYRNVNMSLDGNTVYTPSFSITFNNNAETIVYNNQLALKHLLHDLEITGEFTIPRDSGTAGEDDDAQIIDLLAGDDKRLKIDIGGNNPATTTGDFALDMDVLYKEKEKSNDQEVGNRLPFEQVAGTNNLSVTWSDGIDRVA
jgi:hypothetical protein